jgi:hypothetical protein
LEGVRKFGMHTYMTFWIEALFLGLGVTGLGWEGKGREGKGKGEKALV